MFGPILVATLFRLGYDFIKKELDMDTFKAISAYIFYPLTFPFANMYISFQEVKGKNIEKYLIVLSYDRFR